MSGDAVDRASPARHHGKRLQGSSRKQVLEEEELYMGNVSHRDTSALVYTR